MIYIHTMEDSLATKKNEVLIHTATGTNLKMLQRVTAPATKGHALQDFIHMKCPEETNLQNQKVV